MSKYNNRRVTEDGYSFDSMAEARRYRELKLLEGGGYITALEVHPVYPLVVNGVKVGAYEGDFRYRDCVTGGSVLEDVKGVRTDVYRLKAKLVKALYGVTVVEVQA